MITLIKEDKKTKNVYARMIRESHCIALRQIFKFSLFSASGSALLDSHAARLRK